MNNIFLRFFLILFAGVFQLFSSQISANDLSDGTLKVNNSESIPVKIFASQRTDELANQAFKNISNELIILNEDNIKAESPEHLASIQNILETFKVNKFQFLDKNFKPQEPIFEQKNIENFKYLLKSDKVLKPTDNTELETEFKSGTR